MLHSTAARSLLRGFTKVPAASSSYSTTSTRLHNTTSLHRLNRKRPQVLLFLSRAPTTLRVYSTKPPGPYDKTDPQEQKKISESKLKPKPAEVSAASSVRHVFEESQAEKEGGDEVVRGLMGDFHTIKNTFSLSEVPRESLYFGLAGVIPYAATSLSTVYLAYEINHASATGAGYLFSAETAHELLNLVTPIQIGYGAVILSFLGAIHWGLEYAGYGGHHSYRRYMYGVVPPAVAWPTILMPVEYALITQFVAFNFLYSADARATVRGWFPPWYSTYRFILTFFVGASIVISLVGRGQIVEKDHSSARNPLDHIKAERDAQSEALEREERQIRLQLAEDEEKAKEGGQGEGKEGNEDESKDKGENDPKNGNEEEASKKDDKEEDSKKDDKKDYSREESKKDGD